MILDDVGRPDHNQDAQRGCSVRRIGGAEDAQRVRSRYLDDQNDCTGQCEPDGERVADVPVKETGVTRPFCKQ